MHQMGKDAKRSMESFEKRRRWARQCYEREPMNVIAMRLYPGQDLRQTLLKFCVDRQIDAACIVTCVGSLEKAAIRFADEPEATLIEEKLEIVSLVGTVSRHGCHLHISVSDSKGKMIGGHLKDGATIYTTAEIVLGLLGGIAFKRKFDDRTGYRELSIEPKA